MKFNYLILLVFIMISGCDGSDSNNSIESNSAPCEESCNELASSIDIYISTGELQCEDNALPISATKSYLSEAGVEVNAESCGYLTGVAVPTVCGEADINLHVFTINESDAQIAEQLGFTIPDASIETEQYVKEECDSYSDIDIYISTGELQCQDNGLSISETKGYLSSADIEVSAESCGYLTEVAVPTVCGAADINLHVFTIDESDSQAAENLGFTIPDASTLEDDYAKVTCSD